MKSITFLDKVLIELEHGLRTCFVKPHSGNRGYPADNTAMPEMDDSENQHVAGLMRVNNAGEVAAQGLYRGQAAAASAKSVEQDMLAAAEEENEHLNWCQSRLQELGARRSLLDPFWYLGSFAIGFTAGKAGDQWSLGFVEETENQVTLHLQEHLQRLPTQDQRSREILEQMKKDEMRHAHNAREAGAAELPLPIKQGMKLVSKVMTVSAYRL